MTMTPLDVLEQYWGYDSFRECQAEIIDSILAGHDTIGLMPTGGGKSITFQVPALMLPGLTLVISPLISLMKDQVDRLHDLGIRAGCLNTTMSRHETNVTLERMYNGKLKLLYIAPERLARPEFQARLQSIDLSLIVVDEAHCISQWGYDFRPSYLKISELRAKHPDVPVVALTASATPAVVADIADKLQMRRPAVFSRSFMRDNISYLVRHTEAKLEKVVQVLQNTTGSAIVYVRSRKRTSMLAVELQRNGISADFYHAGLESHEKSERQDRWMSGQTRVMVATNAFGMGIDKADVRVVIHFDLPPSLEEYYQEAGRAGRDGKPAYAVMIASTADKATLKRRVTEEFPPRDYIRDIYDKMCVFLDLAMGEGHNKIFEFNTSEFCHRYSLNPRQASAALKILTRAGTIEFGENLHAKARILVIIDRRDFYDLRLPEGCNQLINAIMRTYTGIFADFVHIDESMLSRATGMTEEEVYQNLLTLSRMKIIQYIPKNNSPYIFFPYNRQESRHITIPRIVYEELLERALERMNAMRDYVFENSSCRVRRMMNYFGDHVDDCGKCDVCREKKRAATVKVRAENIDRSLRDIFATRGYMTYADIKASCAGIENEVIARLRNMMQAGEITCSEATFRPTDRFKP